jgi:hypothetical protein
MRNKLLFLIITFLSIAITSCSSDDTDNTSNDPLHGEWNMHEASSTWFQQSNIEVGSVKFIFDTNTSFLTIENNDESLLYIPESGAYTYTIVEYQGENYIIFEEEGMHVVVDNVQYGYLMTLDENNQWLSIDRARHNFDPGVTSPHASWWILKS